MSTRAKGSGSVFALCSERHGCPDKINGERPKHQCKAPWRGQFEAGYTASGARRYVTVTGTSERDAIRKLRAKQNEVATNGVPAARSGQMNVKRWSETWLPVYQQKVRPTRYTDVRGVVNRYIVPSIGNRKLSALTPADVRAVHKATEDAGYGTATTLRTHDALMVMLKDAQREGVAIPANVMLVRRPKLAESDRDAVPPDDTAAILEVAMGRPDAARWVCAFLQGMRQGECLGLTWECVDLDAGLLDISWQLQAWRIRRTRRCVRLGSRSVMPRTCWCVGTARMVSWRVTRAWRR